MADDESKEIPHENPMEPESKIEEQVYDENVVIHTNIDELYTGSVVAIKQDYARTKLRLTREMVYDVDGLVFNAFIYTGASWAAQVAINKEYLITVSSKASFLSPAKIGDIVEFEANAFFSESKKQEVKVTGSINDIRVFEGSFSVVLLDEHILKIQKKQVDRQAKESRELRAKKQEENAQNN